MAGTAEQLSNLCSTLGKARKRNGEGLRWLVVVSAVAALSTTFTLCIKCRGDKMLPSESMCSAGMKQIVGRASIPNNWDNWGRCPLTQGTR